jgi:ubiquinone/menaquinone biosynthesis C-methylase UbiE
MYKRFAEIYSRGEYPNLSQTMAQVLPSVIETYDIQVPETQKLLDVACGEGSFAVEMSLKGWEVTGVDQSEEMLRLAQHRAQKANTKVNFQKQDMRFLDYSNDFDLATCWFDSLNYNITRDNLQSSFNSVFRTLKPGGWFLFDMNTCYGLSVTWQKNRCYVAQETPELVELHRTSYDYEKHIACLKLTWFVKMGDLWEKFEEKHYERAFTLAEIEDCLQYSGFKIKDRLGSLMPPTGLETNSSRVWFICQK